jgi:nucleotide-binding universal stress UspA family protein
LAVSGVYYGAFTLILPALLFVAIGGVRIRKLYPVLITTIGKDKREENVLHKSVLVPISRPETTESLVDIACDLLAKGGTLRLLNVIEVPQQLPYEYADTKKVNARELLLEASKFCHQRGVTPKLEIVSARDVPEAILDLSKRYKTDLIIMGSSQRSVPEKVLFGNVVDSVLREAHCEVIIFSYSRVFQPIKYERILVPTSGYRHAQRALDIAIHFQKMFGGSITSLFVGSEADAEKANIILKKTRLHAERLGSAIDAVFKTGNVVDNIVNMAKDGKYSLIIIGSTERPSYYTVLLGSTADEIVTKAPCNVLVVRTKK